MNITKPQFVEIIDSIIKQEERDEQIGKALDVVAEGGLGRGIAFSTSLVDNVVKAIDQDDLISWWLWDGPRAGKDAEKFPIELDNQKFVIKDASDLYDFMEITG